VKRTLALGLLVASSALAGPRSSPPVGWTEDLAQANELAAKANKLSHFGGVPAVATAQVFAPKDGPGGLYITALAGKLTDHRDAAARVAVDSFLGMPKRAQLTSSKVSIAQSSSRIDVATKQIEASVQWQDDDAQTITHGRLLIAGDPDNLIAVTAECVMSPATPKVVRDACDQALTTLDTGIAPDKRLTLALAPEGSEPPTTPSRIGGSTTTAPTMSDGTHTPLPPMVMPSAQPRRTVDRRPVYVGAGIVLLAGLFWWNRRRRDALKKDSDE
jgi:hypothetical protein